MEPRDTIDLRVYRSNDGRYHVAAENLKRIGTISGNTLGGTLLKVADAIEAIAAKKVSGNQ